MMSSEPKAFSSGGYRIFECRSLSKKFSWYYKESEWKWVTIGGHFFCDHPPVEYVGRQYFSSFFQVSVVEGSAFFERGILATRSPVFACMFQHDTAEKFSGIVNIPDCSVEAFEVLLRYLYTGNVNTISAENVFSVYYAADKYCIDDLKEHIIEFLKNNLSPENCFDVFTLSVRHSDLELQKLTTDFFCQNLMKLVNTVQWRNFLKENSVEVNKLLRGTLDCLKLKNI